MGAPKISGDEQDLLMCTGGRIVGRTAGFIGKQKLGTYGTVTGFTQMNRPPSWTLGLWSAVKASKEAERNATEQLQARGAHYSTEQGDRGGRLAPQVCLGTAGRGWVF